MMLEDFKGVEKDLVPARKTSFHDVCPVHHPIDAKKALVNGLQDVMHGQIPCSNPHP